MDEAFLQRLLAALSGPQEPVGPGSGQYAGGVGPDTQRAQPTVWEFGKGTPYEGSSFTQEGGAGGVKFKRGSIASAPEMETPENVTETPAGDDEFAEMMKRSEYRPIEDRVAAGESLGNTMLDSGAGSQTGYVPVDEAGGFGGDFQMRLRQMLGGGYF